MKPILGKAWAQRDKLYAESDKLRAEGNLIYCNAVIDVFGEDAKIDWQTGEVTCDERSEIPLGEFD